MKQEKITVKKLKEATKLFTIFLEYDGATFISQTHGKNIEDALSDWVSMENKMLADFIGKTQMKKLKNELLTEVAVKLDGIERMWLINALLKGKLCYIYIVEM